jgi:hypothetical protein
MLLVISGSEVVTVDLAQSPDRVSFASSVIPSAPSPCERLSRLRVIWADLTPCRFPMLFTVAIFTGLIAQEPAGPPKFPVLILQTCHALMTPADPQESRPLPGLGSGLLLSPGFPFVAHDPYALPSYRFLCVGFRS